MQYRTHRHAHIASSAVRKTSITRVVSAARTHTQTVRHTRTYVISILRPPLLTICNIILCIMLCARIIYTTLSMRDVRERGDYIIIIVAHSHPLGIVSRDIYYPDTDFRYVDLRCSGHTSPKLKRFICYATCIIIMYECGLSELYYMTHSSCFVWGCMFTLIVLIIIATTTPTNIFYHYGNQ